MLLRSSLHRFSQKLHGFIACGFFPAIYGVCNEISRCEDTNDATNEENDRASAALPPILNDIPNGQESFVRPLAFYQMQRQLGIMQYHNQFMSNIATASHLGQILPHSNYFQFNVNTLSPFPYHAAYNDIPTNNAVGIQPPTASNTFYAIPFISPVPMFLTQAPPSFQTPQQNQIYNGNRNAPFSLPSLMRFPTNFTSAPPLNELTLNNQQNLENRQEHISKKQKLELSPTMSTKDGFPTQFKDSRGRKSEYKFIGERFIDNPSGRDFTSELDHADFYQMKEDLYKLNGQFQVIKQHTYPFKRSTEPIKAQTFTCQHGKCSIQYTVMRGLEHYGYYVSHGIHHHPHIDGKLSLSLMRLIKSKYTEKGAAAAIMTSLSSMDDRKLLDTLGPDKDALKNEETKAALCAKIVNQVRYLNRKEKKFSRSTSDTSA